MGYTRELVYTHGSALGAGESVWVWVDLAKNLDADFTVIPTQADVWLHFDDYAVQLLGNGKLRHAIKVEHREALNTGFKIRARVFGANIAPASLKKALRTARIEASETRPK